MWNIPRPGIKPMSLALAAGFSNTGPPGKLWCHILHIYLLDISSRTSHRSLKVSISKTLFHILPYGEHQSSPPSQLIATPSVWQLKPKYFGIIFAPSLFLIQSLNKFSWIYLKIYLDSKHLSSTFFLLLSHFVATTEISHHHLSSAPFP